MSLVAGSPALAQVIEIAADGTAVTYGGPTVFSSSGAEPIESAAPPQAVTGGDIAGLITHAAQRHALDPDLVVQVAWQESRFRQSAISPRDAVGVMQLTAGTARELGVDRYDVRQNIDGGAAYLRRMLTRYGGNVPLALAAYNAGPGAVDRHRGVPPYRETMSYVANILARLPARTQTFSTPFVRP